MNPVAELRRGRGLTQSELAAAAGVHLRTVWRMEHDRGSATLPSVTAVVIALHDSSGVSEDELFSVARHFGLPPAPILARLGVQSVRSGTAPASVADTDRLIAKLRVAIAELGVAAVEQHLNDVLMAAFAKNSPPPATAVGATSDEHVMTVASNPRKSPLGPNILEQEFRHYSPAPPPAAPTEPQQSPAKPAPKRRPG